MICVDCFESLQPLLQKLLVVRKPAMSLAQRHRIELIAMFAPHFALLDEAGLRKHEQMLANCHAADREMLGQASDRELPCFQEFHHLAPSGISKSTIDRRQRSIMGLWCTG